MHRARLQRRTRSPLILLYPARHHLVGATTAVKVLLQQSAQLRAETASGLRTSRPGPVHQAHQFSAQSDLSSDDQIPRANPPRSSVAAVSERGPTLLTQRL